jgi:hypothetical protein
MPVITVDMSVQHIYNTLDAIVSKTRGSVISILSNPVKGAKIQLDPPDGPVYPLDTVLSIIGYRYKIVALYNDNVAAGKNLVISVGDELSTPANALVVPL